MLALVEPNETNKDRIDEALVALPLWVVREAQKIIASVNCGFVVQGGTHRAAEVYLGLASYRGLEGKGKEPEDGDEER